MLFKGQLHYKILELYPPFKSKKFQYDAFLRSLCLINGQLLRSKRQKDSHVSKGLIKGTKFRDGNLLRFIKDPSI